MAGGSGSGTCLTALHGVGSTCTWFQATGDWINAVNAENFAGFSDWRVPEQAELETILLAPDPCAPTPCIDPIFGPTASAVTDFYWSATEFPSVLPRAVAVNFADGRLIASLKAAVLHVRAVRSGP